MNRTARTALFVLASLLSLGVGLAREAQPGDDRGGHGGKGRHDAIMQQRTPVMARETEPRDNRGQPEPGDDRGGHHEPGDDHGHGGHGRDG